MTLPVFSPVTGAPMHHHVLLVAEFLLDGYEAKVQGGETYVDRVGLVSYDDGPYEAHFVTMTKQPGLLLSKGDETVMFATLERAGAERLLADALAELESYRG
jgi:hypothetical protein